jgi:hypothetical protein
VYHYERAAPAAYRPVHYVHRHVVKHSHRVAACPTPAHRG